MKIMKVMKWDKKSWRLNDQIKKKTSHNLNFVMILTHLVVDLSQNYHLIQIRLFTFMTDP